MKYDETSQESILEYAQNLIGKTFGEIDKNFRLANSKNKGNLGQVIEESYFEYDINSDARPDFQIVGIELKVTPFKVNKNKTVSAKERMVLNIIDYNEEYKKDFYSSSFWSKNKKILIVLYEYKKDVDPKDYIIQDVFLYEFNDADLFIIKNDWNIIVDKIKAGKAHEISESDTSYLAACTKGASSKSVRTQPFSMEVAKQRAFSLKSGYMTQVIRNRFGLKGNEESILKGKKKTIEQLLEEKFSPFYKKSIDELAKQFGVNIYDKNKKAIKSSVQLVVSRILGLKNTDLSNIEEFNKANIKFKTIRVEKNGKIKEHMSFPNFKYLDIINEEWEDSSLRNLFLEQKYLFVICKFDENDVLRLEKVKLWNMPLSILDTKVKETWEKTVEVINEGLVVTKVGNKFKDNLPKSTLNHVCHVRPHATNREQKYPLPQGGSHTKQCFWLDKNYIEKIISE